MSLSQPVSLENVKMVIARTFKTTPAALANDVSLGKLPGWDSLGHLTLMMEMEREFGLRFPTNKINQPKNAEEICKLINELKEV